MVVFEGLVLALAPLRFEELLAKMKEMDRGTLRGLGLAGVALGVVLIWIGRNLFG